MKRQRKEYSADEVQRRNRRYVLIFLPVIPGLAWPLLAAVKLFLPGSMDSWRDVFLVPLPFGAVAIAGLILTEGAYRVHLWINRGQQEKSRPESDNSD